MFCKLSYKHTSVNLVYAKFIGTHYYDVFIYVDISSILVKIYVYMLSFCYESNAVVIVVGSFYPNSCPYSLGALLLIPCPTVYLLGKIS